MAGQKLLQTESQDGAFATVKIDSLVARADNDIDGARSCRGAVDIGWSLFPVICEGAHFHDSRGMHMPENLRLSNHVAKMLVGRHFFHGRKAINCGIVVGAWLAGGIHPPSGPRFSADSALLMESAQRIIRGRQVAGFYRGQYRRFCFIRHAPSEMFSFE